MPTPIVAGNWKMHTTLEEARNLTQGVVAKIAGVTGVEVVLCPPFPYLLACRDILHGSGIHLGAQNMHSEDKGAFTGEVAPSMLAELCEFVIIGHSERRQHFGETDAAIARKVQAALAAGLSPILCVGEALEQRRAGQAEAVVGAQLQAALEAVEAPGGLAIAYEPVWAIGTGVAATPDTAAHIMGGPILAGLAAIFGEHAALDVPLLYGGSVNPGNIAEFAAVPAVHGALVGGASLKADDFAEIVRITAQAKGSGGQGQ